MSNTYCSYPNINGIEGKKCPSIETEISSGLRDSEDLRTHYGYVYNVLSAMIVDMKYSSAVGFDDSGEDEQVPF